MFIEKLIIAHMEGNPKVHDDIQSTQQEGRTDLIWMVPFQILTHYGASNELNSME
jgi:hypothetical protein